MGAVNREGTVTKTRLRYPTHKDVDYAVDDAGGRERTFKRFDEAAAFALDVAISGGKAKLDVLVWSRAGAKFYGGDDAVKEYNEDPEASVFQRFEIKVNAQGRVP